MAVFSYRAVTADGVDDRRVPRRLPTKKRPSKNSVPWASCLFQSRRRDTLLKDVSISGL